jgi:hypothetical protein
MGRNFLWSQDADDEQQGSFSDIKSQHTYDNVDDFTKVDRANDAQRNGDEVVSFEDPIDGSGRDTSADQRHNLYYSEQNDHGDHSPRKYGPGR